MSLKNKEESYTDVLSRLVGWKYPNKKTIEVTFQITEECTLRCLYCYQHNKSPKEMTVETGKEFIDVLFKELKDEYYCIVLDFIGGEPLLMPELISSLVDYWDYKCIMENLTWGRYTRVSICSNGTEWDLPEVQKLIKKLGNRLSFTVSIDGNKELHDSARLHIGGQGSYDEAIHAATEYERISGQTIGSKMTIAPSNIPFVYSALKHYLDSGKENIFANCVYEEGWTYEHASLLYNEMKKLADYKLENYPEVYLSFFEEDFFTPLDPENEDDNRNWCWGKGTLILTDHGYQPIETLKVGDLVYTHTGELKPIIQLHQHFADNVCNISASGIFDSVCTKNHKLFVRPFDYQGYSQKFYKADTKEEVQNIQHKDLLFLYKHRFGSEHLDSNIAYLIGRYIGDGYTTTQGGHSIVCANDEVEELKPYFNDFTYGLYDGKETKEFHFHKDRTNKNNVIINTILDDCGILAHNKRLPKIVWSLDKESVINLVKGYMAADGTIDKSDQYRYNTTSGVLAEEMMILLRSIGFTPTCYLNKREGKSTILGREVNIKNRYEVYFYKQPSRARYVKQEDEYCTTYGLKIKDAEPQEVYNITVADNHSYIANGLVSSNCGGNGLMLACDPDGILYPCLRYMPSSVGRNRESYITCGDTKNGIDSTILNEMRSITRRSQSTDECFYCPIAKGCSWCTAYNWEVTGSYNKRATYICPMHKARALINIYYWNKYYRNIGSDMRKEMHCPKEWALEIISEEEYNMLLELSK